MPYFHLNRERGEESSWDLPVGFLLTGIMEGLEALPA